MKTVNNIRQSFFDYYVKNGHQHVESSSLVPLDDPSLMFTNAGMVQFKKAFIGLEELPYKTAVTAQKCVRAGGKHNDLDNVGYTARHHTFFEMLGNFSFGDYFKEQAIFYAWNFLTKELDIAPEKLLVTVFYDDEEARDLWKKIAGFSDDKIISIATSDNFWSMGDTGPCGPCSEIFYDHGEHVFGGVPGSPDEDGDRFVEIWNLVFMQYNQITKDKREKLPKPCIDTGAGIERLAAVLQNVCDNFQIDLFRNLIASIEDELHKKANLQNMASYKILADHLRSICFLISDGILPSNEGRGYVLRRIMRRAMRHAHLLECDQPVIYRMIPHLINEMGAAYPELGEHRALLEQVVKNEEEKFATTLHRGVEMLNRELPFATKEKQVSGDLAFKLYDTYGFPVDLTQDIIREKGLELDMAAFEAAMQQQQQRARASWVGSGSVATEDIWFELKNKICSTDFAGYEKQEIESKVVAILKDGCPVNQWASNDEGEGHEYILLLDKTVFYAESGGQIADIGVLFNQQVELQVEDVQKKPGGLFAHKVKIIRGSVKLGDSLHGKIDVARRKKIAANHSATHLLHKALREVLGEAVTQKGSLVSDSRLRFDFAYSKPLTKEEISEIEDKVNSAIINNAPVQTIITSLEEAKADGAMALFGEKYDSNVRMVSICCDNADGLWSKELCGGTHVSHTGDIGNFVILSQSSVSSGVRRIEALTGQAAINYYRERIRILNEVANLLKVNWSECPNKISAILEERKSLINNSKKAALSADDGSRSNAIQIADVNCIFEILHNVNSKELKGRVDGFKKTIGEGIFTLFSIEDNGKVTMVVGVTESLLGRFDARDIVKQVTALIGAKGGGGRTDLAQSGGNEAGKIDQTIDVIKKYIDTKK